MYIYREIYIYIYKIYPPFPFPFKQTHVFCFFFGGQPSSKGQARSAWRRAGQPGVAGRGAHRQPPNRTLTDVFQFFPYLHVFLSAFCLLCWGGLWARAPSTKNALLSAAENRKSSSRSPKDNSKQELLASWNETIGTKTL